MTETPDTYFPRLADNLLEELLSGFPAVLVVGPRACGKTTTAARHARTIIRLDREAEAGPARIDPDGTLDAPRPILLDEWQLAPEVLAAVKRAVDARPGPNSFLITGSVRADMDAAGWPLTGRALRVEMFGLTEREIAGNLDHSPIFDRISRKGAAALEQPHQEHPLNDYIERAIRGGFPDAVLAPTEQVRRRWLSAYAEQLVTRDADLIDANRDPVLLRRYLTSICLNTAGLVNIATLSQSTGINRKTAQAYDRLLENLLVTEQIPAWWTNRLKRLVQTPKRYVVDSGLVGAVLGLDLQGVRKDGNILGRLLDTFVMSQLRAEAAASSARPRLFHLRTHGGRNEIDLVAEYEDGRVFGIEIKAGSAPSPRDARHLRWLADEIGEQFIGGAVLHTGPHRYRLDDQIVAAPISALWAS